jgi:hypothetical protein
MQPPLYRLIVWALWPQATALLAIAGCYAPTYSDCEITCVNGTCPSGFECRDNVCRAPGVDQSCSEILADAAADGPSVDGDPNADTDQDMVNDAIDNCREIKNLDQHDEDGDKLGDVCDPCPPYAQYMQGANLVDANVDGDGDGVGDGCDPFPAQTGHKIIAFYGFGGNAVPPEMKLMPATAPAWTVSGDKVMTATNQYSRLEVMPTIANGKQSWVATRAAFSPASTQLVRGAGLVHSADPSGYAAACLVGMPTPVVQAHVMLTISATDMETARQTFVLQAPQPADLRLTRVASTVNFQCSEHATTVSDSFPAGTGALGLHVRLGTGTFEWFMVIEGPPAPTP